MSKSKARRPAAQAVQTKRILVVEDNPVTRKSVRLTLQVEGYEVMEAEDGAGAVAQLRRQTADLVLLDLLLPDIHGAELIKQLRGLPGAKDIPILAFSGLVSRIEEARMADAGFTDFLLKPVEPSRLVRVVASFLVPQSSAIDQPGKGKRVLLVDDDPVQLKMLRLQFEHVGFEVETADHGVTALQQARRRPPQVVVTDLLMPHLDGFDLCVEMRRDPGLRELPIVVHSANYVEAADQDLAQRMGASAYVFRDDGFDALLTATLDSLSRPVPAPMAISPELERERYKRIVRQLERQTSLHVASVQRNIVQSAILHELGLLAEMLAKRKDLESTLDELLAYCLDGAGLSKGVLYLAEADAGLALRAQYGCLPCVEEARSFFGAPDLFRQALRSGDTVILPSAGIDAAQAESFLAQAQAHSALIIPVHAGDQALAVLLLLSMHRDLMEHRIGLPSAAPWRRRSVSRWRCRAPFSAWLSRNSATGPCSKPPTTRSW